MHKIHFQKIVLNYEDETGARVGIDIHCRPEHTFAEGVCNWCNEKETFTEGFNYIEIEDPEDLYDSLREWWPIIHEPDQLVCDTPLRYTLAIITDEGENIINGNTFNTAVEAIVMKMVWYTPRSFRDQASLILFGVSPVE